MNSTDAPAVHEWTGPTGVKFRDVRGPSDTYYRDTTPRAVIDALEKAMEIRANIRVFLGDSETGQSWHEEHDVAGRIGRSMGPIKIPLLIPTSRSYGGTAILTDCIVCLFVNGREVYRHPKYEMPEITIFNEGKYPDLPWAANIKTSKPNHINPHARFKSELAAKRWQAFMRGERAAK